MYSRGAVIDVGLPDGDGMDLLDAFRLRWWSAPALVLTGRFEPALVNRAQRTGAEYSVKPLEFDSLDSFASRLVAPRDATEVRRECAAFAKRYGFTPSEGRILALAGDGVARDDIPVRLGLSENTVKSQVRSLLHKSGDFELADLVRRVLKRVAEA